MKKLFIALMMISASSAAVAQVTQPQVTLGPSSAILSLTAQGESRRLPDVALFSAGVVTQSETASAALRENSTRMEQVIAALKRAGIADRDIQTASINLSPRYYHPEREAAMRARQAGQPYVPPPEDLAPRIVGYEARNSVQVRVRDLSKMGQVIDTLVSVGANEVNGPNFTLDEQDAAMAEARAEAVAEGRQTAEVYARAAGMRIGRIISISEGGGNYPVQQSIVLTGSRGGPPPPPPPAPLSDAPVAPGELSLSIAVSMQFELIR